MSGAQTERASKEADDEAVDDGTRLLVRLICDLDALVRAMRDHVPRGQPWQRLLRDMLSQADGQMQALRVAAAMQRPEAELLQAAEVLNATCQRIKSSIRGSRADGNVRAMVTTIARMGDGLAGLMAQRCR